METINNAIHVTKIVARYLELIAEGTETGEYDSCPFPSFGSIARDFADEGDDNLISRVSPLVHKITQELFDDFV
jgi:hypothetical protein